MPKQKLPRERRKKEKKNQKRNENFLDASWKVLQVYNNKKQIKEKTTARLALRTRVIAKSEIN